MKRTFAAALGALLSVTVPAYGSPVMVVKCSAPAGLNIAPDIERDQPRGSVKEVYDPAVNAYISHPRKTHSVIVIVNGDGAASETSFGDEGSSLVTDMRVVGTINNNAITLIDGENGYVDLLTLYPKESLAIFAGTSYTGWHKAVPTGYAYISHCKFSQ